MALRSCLYLFATSACLTTGASLKPTDVFLAQKKKALVNPEAVPTSFNLGDIFNGGSLPQGMGAWTSIFQKLGAGQTIGTQDVTQAMKVSAMAGNGGIANIDSQQLQQKLDNPSIQDRLQKLTQNPEFLMKAVQDNPKVQQLAKSNPAIGNIIQDKKTLSKIFTPQMVQKVLNGEPMLDEALMKDLLVAANVTAPSNEPVPEGLKLKQVRPGNGKSYPKDGDRVVVQYKGFTKDGASFGSGRFSFLVGSSEAIQGWDLGVKRMSLGERAVLQVPSALAYGSAGKGPIPPNSDLVFDVNLLEIS